MRVAAGAMEAVAERSPLVRNAPRANCGRSNIDRHPHRSSEIRGAFSSCAISEQREWKSNDNVACVSHAIQSFASLADMVQGSRHLSYVR